MLWGSSDRFLLSGVHLAFGKINAVKKKEENYQFIISTPNNINIVIY